jgi:hypothetical protein
VSGDGIREVGKIRNKTYDALADPLDNFPLGKAWGQEAAALGCQFQPACYTIAI